MLIPAWYKTQYCGLKFIEFDSLYQILYNLSYD